MPITYSIIIPTLGGSKRISTVLDSLCRQSVQLNQLEIIIIDDGSPISEFEKLNSVVSEYVELTIKLIRSKKNYGPATARNLGIDNATGEYYFFTDDDCELPADWIETHMSMYKKYPYISSVFGWYTETAHGTISNIYKLWMSVRYAVLFNSSVLSRSHFCSFYSPRLNFTPCNTANLSIHKKVIETVRFNEMFITPGYEDLEFGERIIRSGFVALYIPYFVMHDKEMSFRKFMRLAKNRAYGFFVYKLINQSVTYPGATRSTLTFFEGINALDSAPLIWRNKFKLKFLVVVWYLYTSPFTNFFYNLVWKKKMHEKSVATISKAFISAIPD
jgi:glycosyltransferase involved in cell wall biosynthesis